MAKDQPNAIAKARQNAGLTQSRLAAKLGIARTLLVKYERGGSVPNAVRAIQIAQALDVRVEDLWATRIHR